MEPKIYQAAHDWRRSIHAAALGMALALAGLVVIAITLGMMRYGHAGLRRNPIGPALSLVCLGVSGSVSMLVSAAFRYPRILLSEHRLTWQTLTSRTSARWTDLAPFLRHGPVFGMAPANEEILATFTDPRREPIVLELRRFNLSAHALVVELNRYRDHALAQAGRAQG